MFVAVKSKYKNKTKKNDVLGETGLHCRKSREVEKLITRKCWCLEGKSGSWRELVSVFAHKATVQFVGNFACFLGN